ncbi:hypothetical protein Taro_003786 [Colocasia esculenta]|uniref:Transposase Tnp1/En/Spm-like domain-containing protein n=1 Tax=Colocasia esculenta TaxID=4460 RepID=A0A843TPU0_COLES|nr:hypothetical protein [Colocasia esculenta]
MALTREEAEASNHGRAARVLLDPVTDILGGIQLNLVRNLLPPPAGFGRKYFRNPVRDQYPRRPSHTKPGMTHRSLLGGKESDQERCCPGDRLVGEFSARRVVMLMERHGMNAHEGNASPSIHSFASSHELQHHNRKVMVYLKSFKKSLVNVALAIIESKDPLKNVGGCDLRCEYWEVAINVALVYNEPLPRPYGQFKTIGDAIGATIAWPFTLVVLYNQL